MTSGPVGFRGSSDSISSIQGGAESHLGGGEVRPFSPGYDPAVNPGEALWVDPNASVEGDAAFGLDGACDDAGATPELVPPGLAELVQGWEQVGGPFAMSQVIGLAAALASKVSQAAFDALVAQFEQHLLDGDGGGGGGVTIGQVNAAINAALVSVLADINTLSTDLGALSTALSGKQVHSSELDILAAITSTPVGRQILTAASFGAMRTLLSIDAVANTAPADLPVSTAAAAAIAAAISTAATDATTKANAASDFAIQRGNHTGTQSADTLTDGITNKAFLATERTKLAGVASGATANATDAQLRDRSTHTGTQPLSTISDAGDAASRNVGTTSTTVAAGDAPAAAQAAAVATASADATTKANARIPLALVDAKGDLLVATAPDTVDRLPVGTDGQVLVADSTQTPGVKWAGAAAGITNGMPRVSGDTVRAFTIPGAIPISGLSTATPSTNRPVFQPIRLDRQRVFDQIQLEVTTAAVSGSRCRTAIYAVDDYWQATNLVFDSGQMANDAIAVVTAGVSLTLPAGNYMMETVSQGSATFRVTNCLPPWLNAFKAAAGVSGFLNVFTAGGNSNVANGFPAVADNTVKFEGTTGTTAFTIAYYARLREAA